MAPSLRLRAFVAPTEARAVEQAARKLAEAADTEASVEAVPSLEALAAGTAEAIFVCSLLPEVEAALADWPATEARLIEVYEALAKRDSRTLFLCTVFRHAPPELDEDARVELRLAIRRLDLLAVRLSHATGLNVVDLDRALAQIGALNLDTDFRLSGPTAAEAAGREIARCIAAAGLDEWIAPEVQERAAAALAAS
jgi:hypothetical protein